MYSSLSRWLAHLETAHARAIDLGLDRLRRVARALDADRFDCPVITVGGTNGKGSTVAALSAVYLAAGYRLGTYTSPHLVHFNERICLDGQPVTDEILVEAFREVEASRRQADVSLTYFEFTTLAAFLVFRQAKPDVVILEVGLGGRLDAVNLVDADIAVITSIGIDHTDWLGDTREAISFEKAGIFRQGKPVVCGDREPPEPLLAQAVALSCPLIRKGRDYDFELTAQGWNWRGVKGRMEGLPQPRLALENVSTALTAVEALGLPVNETACRSGILQAAVAGRLERLALHGVEIVLDVAHNPHGAAFFMQQLPPAAGRVRAVFAMLADKDAGATLDACLGRVDVWYPAALPVARGQSGDALLPLLMARGMCVEGVFPHVGGALASALSASHPGDRILVFGSFYTVSAAREWLEKHHGYSY